MNKWLIFFMLYTSSCYGMLLEKDSELGKIDEEEYYCKIAMEMYFKKTKSPCDPSIKPYLRRVINHSVHNGDSIQMQRIKSTITADDEIFLVGLVNSAVNVALKDKESQIQERIPREKVKIYMAAAGLVCTVLTTIITVTATLKDCHK